MKSLNLHLRVVMKNALTSLEVELWCHKPKHVHVFTNNSLQRALQHLIKCYYLGAGNLAVLQTTRIPMSIDLAPFWLIYICQNVNEILCVS